MTDFNDPALEEGFFEPDARRRYPWWLFLLIGLALGLAVGLGYAWGLNPVQFYNTDPVDLRPQHKETWMLLVAATYRQEGDLDRALARLAGLDDPQIGQTVAALTERYMQAGNPATQVRALAALADALGARSTNMLIYLATPEPTLFFSPTPEPPTAIPSATSTATPTRVPTTTPTPQPTPTATPTVTPRPTLTRHPTPTSPPPYYLEAQERLCQSDRGAPRIEIFVQTQAGAGIPGSEIWVTWSGGADRFVTGLKPEIGLGYADFDMAPGVAYAVAVGEPGLQVVRGLSAEPCLPGEGDSPLASWRLTIVATSDALTPTPTRTPTAPPAATATAPPAATATATPPPTPTRTAP
jgi:hypothetical protein